MAKLALGRASDSCHFAVSRAAWQKSNSSADANLKQEKTTKFVRERMFLGN